VTGTTLSAFALAFKASQAPGGEAQSG